MAQELEFAFKGKRDYVHGTSLFNAALDVARAQGLGDGTIDIAFKHMITTPRCELELRKPGPRDAVAARIQNDAGVTLELCVNPAESEAEEAQREPYDESAMCRDSEIFGTSITLSTTGHDDAIEVLVALCKKMHQASIDGSKKWVFSRYRGIIPLPVLTDIEIVTTKRVGVRLTCNAVYVGGHKIGDMFFSC